MKLRYLLLVCGIMLSVAACAKPDATTAADPRADFAKMFADNANSCYDIALQQTKAKMDEADVLKAEGKTSEWNATVDEAMKIFETEEPAYTELNKANEANIALAKELKARQDAMANDAAALNAKVWAQVSSQVDTHLANAKVANEKCDPATAKQELDAAKALLDEMESKIASAVVITETQTTAIAGDIYNVKKGDCLWNIAGKQYNNPFMWPLIYWANQNQIKDPDLIYPGQKIEVVKEIIESDKVKARKFAQTRGAWNLYDGK